MAVGVVLPALPQPGDDFDRHQIVCSIGTGGMAAVYAARRVARGGFDKLVAVKVLLPHLAADPRFVDMFLDEARISAMLQHRNLAQVFDTGTWHGLPYLVMELLRGKAFSELIARAREVKHPLGEPVIRAVLAGAADGLHAAHTAVSNSGEPLGVVHRDVSPQNLHLGYDGTVRVVDFGIATASGRLSVTRTGEVKGKLALVAPEQIDPSYGQVSARTDVWALGVVAWEALAGRRLFSAGAESETLYKVLQAPIPRLADVAQVSTQLSELVGRCLQRDPMQRPATAAEVAAEAAGTAFSPAAAAQCVSEAMQHLFCADRLAEDAQFAGALAPAAAPVKADPSSPGGSRRRARVGALIGIATVTVAAVAVVGYSIRPAPARLEPAPAQRAASSAGETAPPPPVVPPTQEAPAVAAEPAAERVVDAPPRGARSKRKPAAARAPAAKAPPQSTGPGEAPVASSPLLSSPYAK